MEMAILECADGAIYDVGFQIPRCIIPAWQGRTNSLASGRRPGARG